MLHGPSMSDVDILGERGYRGPERRHHRMFVTRNSEYHCRDGVCVAVRDRHTGEFFPSHSAIGRRMSAGLRFGGNGGVASVSAPDAPRVGDQLCFSSDDTTAMMATDVITSPLRAIERPPKDVVRMYPN